MVTRSVTLHANDSVNLSTGQVTRSSQSQTDTERHHRIMIKGLRANLLVALQRAIEDDESIPSSASLQAMQGPTIEDSEEEWSRKLGIALANI